MGNDTAASGYEIQEGLSMIVYFCDREFEIRATASTHLPDSVRIISDQKREELESGVKTFDFTVLLDDHNRGIIRKHCCVGNFVLRSSEDENEFYTIIETEQSDNEYRMYCEDAGLDLLNTVAPAYTATEAHNMAWYINHFITGLEWSIGLDESPDRSLTLVWDGESTLTERLISIANSFNCEIGYSYQVRGLTVVNKYIDVYARRGNKVATDNYYIDKDVSMITVKKSIAELATAFVVEGGVPDGKSSPINLSGANYSSDGTTTHSPAVASDDFQIVGKQVRCLSAMAKWRSNLDSDGLLVRTYSYDTTNKKELFSHAVAELRKVTDEIITYDVEFNRLNARIGDRINIVDDKDELYVDARVLTIEKSVTADTISAELGEYIIRASGISDRLLALSKSIQENASLLYKTSEIATEALTNSGISFTIETDYSDALTVTLTAHVYKGENDVTADYPESLFYWYSKAETGIVPLGDGYSVTYNRSDAGFGTTVVCSFAMNEYVVLTTPDNLILATPDNKALLAYVKEREVS